MTCAAVIGDIAGLDGITADYPITAECLKYLFFRQIYKLAFLTRGVSFQLIQS